ncbi:MAG: tRNA pseudouridine(38-40) synthase TruA [Bacillota bacterium]
MLNTLIRISYDGTNYSGFQIQTNAPTVQAEVERALGVIYKQKIRIIGAGRTDAGVHALGQAASFLAPFRIAVENLPQAINGLLPSDIVIIGAEEVPEDFHARFSADKKVYSYTLDRCIYPRVMKRLYSLHLPGQLDLAVMREAADMLVGTHDFKAFQASGSTVNDTKRTLFSIDLIEKQSEQMLCLYYEGSGFLYRMVRLMTGTLIRVGKAKLEADQVEVALLGINPSAVGPTVPAHGLCLEKVSYDY